MEFEGPEKKLEIHVRPGFGSLRELGLPFWEGCVSAARAAILSQVSNESCDAFLLSESSLFVAERRLTMITCGQTTLADAALYVLAKIGPENVEFLCYERKNELFPERQPTSFAEDAARLESALGGGRRLQFGDPKGNHVSVFFHENNYEPHPRDTTLEVLMHGIGENALARFARGPSEVKKTALRREAALGSLLAGFQVDDHLFEPMGYSLNAIREEWYYTVHVTPNPGSAYVSFETNYHILDEGGERALQRITNRLIEAFEPEHFSMLLFHRSPKLASAGPAYELRQEERYEVGASYNVLFQDYQRKP